MSDMQRLEGNEDINRKVSWKILLHKEGAAGNICYTA